MAETNSNKRVIRARDVHSVRAPVLVESHQSADGHTDTIAIVPLADGNEIKGFEVRCQCGASVVIECVYEEEPS